jgi:hypothetical protein
VIWDLVVEVVGALATGLMAVGDALVTFGAYFEKNAVTLLYAVVVCLGITWLVKLHFDPRYKEFNMARLVMQHNGEPDAEKMRMWSTYSFGTVAFFFLLYHDRPAFVTYAPWFLGIAFAHLVGNRMTTRTGVGAPSPETARPDAPAPAGTVPTKRPNSELT